MTEELKIVLTAEVDPAIKSVQKFADVVEKKVPAAAARADAALDKVTETMSKDIPAAAAKAAAANDKIASTSGKASFAVLNFGRIAQDSAFGFIGIANNIEPFIQSLGSLKRESGSTKNAISSFFGAITGPAGIGILIGAISLLDSYSKGYGIFAGRLKDAKEKNDKLKDSIDSINESMTEERTRLLVLTKAAADDSISKDRRLNAIKALRTEFGPYFADLTNEQILNGNVAGAVDLATQAILRKAKAASKEKELAIEFENQEKLTKNLVETQNKLRQVTEQRRKAQEQLNEAADSQTRGGLSTLVVKLAGDIEDLAAKERVLVRDTLEADLTVQTLASSVAQLTPEFVKSEKSVTAAGKATTAKTAAVKELTAAEKENAAFLAQTIQKREADLTVQKATTAEIEAATAAEKARKLAQATGPLGAGLGPASFAAFDPTALQATAAEAAAAAAATQASADAANNAQVAYGLLSPAIDGVFNALTSDDPFGNLLQSLKQFIVGLVKAVAQALILQALLSAFAPGAGAVGGGGFGGGFLGKLLGFRANGGPVGAGNPYIVGESGPELFVPQTSGSVVPNMALSGGGTLSATVSGNDLLFILNQANSNRRNNFG